MLKRICGVLVLACLVGLAGQPVRAQEGAWVQIEARPSLREAEARARAYSNAFPDVNGFRLPSGWYAITLGPYSPAEAEQRLADWLRDRMVPADSYIVDGSTFGQRYWPVAAARGDQALARDMPVVEVFPDGTDAPPPARNAETVGEALAGEAALSRAERARLQEALQAQGFYSGAIDAAFGPGTRSAMAGWQAAEGHEPTGVLTSAQRAALLAAQPASENGPASPSGREPLQITVLPLPDADTDADADADADATGAPATATPQVAPMPDAEAIMPARSASGIYVNTGGDVATSLATVAGCGRVTLDRGHPATLLLEAPELGLAVLRPEIPLAPQGAAEFRPLPPAPQTELAVAGYSFGEVMSRPALSFGHLAAEEGADRHRLTLRAMEGDAGGPVLDGSGAVLGMLLPPGADDGRLLPEEVAYALPAAALAERLRAAGIPVGESDRHAALDPADLAQLAARITPLVSCWE